MRGFRVAIAVLCTGAVLAACGQAALNGGAAEAGAQSLSSEPTLLPGDATCDDVMAWARSGWTLLSETGAPTSTTAKRALRELADNGHQLGIRTEDPLLSLIASVAAAASVLANGRVTVEDQDVRKNAQRYLEQIAHECKAPLT